MIAVVWLLLYVALSLPVVQKKICTITCRELSELLGTWVEIESIGIEPFNSAVVRNIEVYDQQGRPLLRAEKIGAGISLWRLITDHRLDFTHAEIIGMGAHVIQDSADSPLNLQFIIDSLQNKEDKKEPSKFDFSIRHIVIRKTMIAFDRLWQPAKAAGLDVNHILVTDFNADVALPLMANDNFNIDARKITFKEKSGINVKKLAVMAHVSPQLIELRNLELRLDKSYIHCPTLSLALPAPYDFKGALTKHSHSIVLKDNIICPADLAFIMPQLASFKFPLTINLDAHGGLNDVVVSNLLVTDPASGLNIKLQGKASEFKDLGHLDVSLPVLDLNIPTQRLQQIIEVLHHLPQNISEILLRAGYINAHLPITLHAGTLTADAEFASALGNAKIHGSATMKDDDDFDVTGKLEVINFNIGRMLDNSRFGMASLSAEASIIIRKGEIDGEAATSIASFGFNQEIWSGISLNVAKNGSKISCDINSSDPKALVSGTAIAEHLADNSWILQLNSQFSNLNFGLFKLQTQPSDYSATAAVTLNAAGSNIDNLIGNLSVENLTIHNSGASDLTVGNIFLNIEKIADDTRKAILAANPIKGYIETNAKTADIVSTIKHMLAQALPAVFPASSQLPPWLDPIAHNGYLKADFTIVSDNVITRYFNTPITLLHDVAIHADISENSGIGHLTVRAPYLLQGKDKIISDTRLEATFDASSEYYGVQAVTNIPVKSNRMTLSLKADALNNLGHATLSWLIDRKGSFRGSIGFEALLDRQNADQPLALDMKVIPSVFDVNDTTWHVDGASIKYADNTLDIHGTKIWSGEQFVEIEGRGSALPTDTISLRLNDIDLSYVFETLAINYVNFGGRATGDFYATSIFSPAPVAFTPRLSVSNFAYNNAVLGDADISSHWDNNRKEVCINASINEAGRHTATIDGGVFVTRDSLSFSLDADKVNIKFLQPFMEAFTSSVDGRASGKAKLYGTFSDIDLAARLKADTIAMKVDYTNVTYYGGSDSIIINPGLININNFKLYDREGHTAILNGYVKHRFFHEPVFDFRITQARNLLCYDTNQKLNPDWYGKIYGIGAASIFGKPGITEIQVDMQTAPGSQFTFVLSEMEMAADYNFLTFTDTRKARLKDLAPDTLPPMLKLLQHKIEAAEPPSVFNMNLRATVTPQTEMIIVMDPIAGDKIKAFGSGAMQLAYSTSDEELSMHGRYTLDKGTYNFSLQDLILKTFTIRPGSYIAFNGNPYHATLGIDAVYKVNTNLSDLDKSFSTDKDLNRTNVPVEAILKVTGELQHPDISFDVELPTLTQDVTRKVKSIISTDEMMNRQIIYLLALNRFYTPEYMGASNSNNELASFASTTLSSHLTNILGQLSNNWNFAPSIRTDAGDFSDMEVDFALSSSLLNNRLLLNGNFGYRDRSTSSTTFIGDFDLEYLLNKRGSLRLKAYNHYNDQNYYLKSALTTQGVGVVYKHDFNKWFNFLRRKKKKKSSIETQLHTDSIR